MDEQASQTTGGQTSAGRDGRPQERSAFSPGLEPATAAASTTLSDDMPQADTHQHHDNSGSSSSSSGHLPDHLSLHHGEYPHHGGSAYSFASDSDRPLRQQLDAHRTMRTPSPHSHHQESYSGPASYPSDSQRLSMSIGPMPTSTFDPAVESSTSLAFAMHMNDETPSPTDAKLEPSRTTHEQEQEDERAMSDAEGNGAGHQEPPAGHRIEQEPEAALVASDTTRRKRRRSSAALRTRFSPTPTSHATTRKKATRRTRAKDAASSSKKSDGEDEDDHQPDEEDAPDEPAARESGSEAEANAPSKASGKHAGDVDCSSVMECGTVRNGERILQEYLPFFMKEVELYTAESDPTRRVLVRASQLAELFQCATNKVGMYLSRRKHIASGLYQATSFKYKPSGRTGLKAGGYFIAMCLRMGTLVVRGDGRRVPCEQVKAGEELLGEGGKIVVVRANPQLPPARLYRVATSIGDFEATIDHRLTVAWERNLTLAVVRVTPPTDGTPAAATHSLRMTYWCQAIDGRIHTRTTDLPCCLLGEDGVDEEREIDTADADGSDFAKKVAALEAGAAVDRCQMTHARSEVRRSPVLRLHDAARTGVALLTGTYVELYRHAQCMFAEQRASDASPRVLVKGTVLEMTVGELIHHWGMLSSSTAVRPIGVPLPLDLTPAGDDFISRIARPPFDSTTAARNQVASMQSAAADLVDPVPIHAECNLFVAKSPDCSHWPLRSALDRGYVPKVGYQLHNPLQADRAVCQHARGRAACTFLHLDAAEKALGIVITPDTGLITTEVSPIATPTGEVAAGRTMYDRVCRAGMLASLQLGLVSLVSFGWFGRARWTSDALGLRDPEMGVAVIEVTQASHSIVGPPTDVAPFTVDMLRVSYTLRGESRVLLVVFAPHPSMSSQWYRIAAAIAFAHGRTPSQVAESLQRLPMTPFGQSMLPRFRSIPALLDRQRHRIVSIEIDAAEEDDRRYIIATPASPSVGILTHNSVCEEFARYMAQHAKPTRHSAKPASTSTAARGGREPESTEEPAKEHEAKHIARAAMKSDDAPSLKSSPEAKRDRRSSLSARNRKAPRANSKANSWKGTSSSASSASSSAGPSSPASSATNSDASSVISSSEDAPTPAAAMTPSATRKAPSTTPHQHTGEHTTTATRKSVAVAAAGTAAKSASPSSNRSDLSAVATNSADGEEADQEEGAAAGTGVGAIALDSSPPSALISTHGLSSLPRSGVTAAVEAATDGPATVATALQPTPLPIALSAEQQRETKLELRRQKKREWRAKRRAEQLAKTAADGKAATATAASLANPRPDLPIVSAASSPQPLASLRSDDGMPTLGPSSSGYSSQYTDPTPTMFARLTMPAHAQRTGGDGSRPAVTSALHTPTGLYSSEFTGVYDASVIAAQLKGESATSSNPLALGREIIASLQLKVQRALDALQQQQGATPAHERSYTPTAPHWTTDTSMMRAKLQQQSPLPLPPLPTLQQQNSLAVQQQLQSHLHHQQHLLHAAHRFPPTNLSAMEPFPPASAATPFTTHPVVDAGAPTYTNFPPPSAPDTSLSTDFFHLAAGGMSSLRLPANSFLPPHPQQPPPTPPLHPSTDFVHSLLRAPPGYQQPPPHHQPQKHPSTHAFPTPTHPVAKQPRPT